MDPLLRHAVRENGDCAPWCRACDAERRARKAATSCPCCHVDHLGIHDPYCPARVVAPLGICRDCGNEAPLHKDAQRDPEDLRCGPCASFWSQMGTARTPESESERDRLIRYLDRNRPEVFR